MIEKGQTEQYFDILIEDAKAHFNRIDPDLDNGEVLRETINTTGITDFIVHRIAYAESNSLAYYDDLELMTWYNSNIASDRIKVPTDPVYRLRWLALLCITACLIEDFPAGNVVIVAEYLPEDSDEFLEYGETHGESVLEDIIRKRKAVSQNGWIY